MNSRRGMTLLEVTLALGLLAVLSVFVMQVINSVTDLWSSGERRGRGDLVFATAVERFRGDLAALHRGRRGWFILDSYIAEPEEEGQPAWRLPRLRFLAEGAALPDLDPSGRHGVEVMWVVEPERSGTNNRLARLVRYGQIEGDGVGLRDGGQAERLRRQGDGLVVLDGLLWAEFHAADPIRGGALSERLRIEPNMPVDFPSRIDLLVEGVSGALRERPPVLDDEVSAETINIRVRGTAPLEQPTYALIEREWVQLGGNFPQLTLPQRGVRDSIPMPHPARTPIYMPESHQAVNPLPGQGRRQK